MSALAHVLPVAVLIIKVCRYGDCHTKVRCAHANLKHIPKRFDFS